MKKIIGELALVLLVLALAACQPGGSSTGAASATGTPRSAPINVPAGYQGLVLITFSSGATYDQAAAILQSAGMKLQVPCPNPGPIIAGATPKPNDQRASFAATHKLSAIGNPRLTQAMLNQVAASPQVMSVDKEPVMECPLAAPVPLVP
jgi:hypothetical protein